MRTLYALRPAMPLDEVDVSRCLFAPDCIGDIGDEITLYERDGGGGVRLIGRYDRPGDALAALDARDLQ
jgi:hypothetical protein